MKAKIRFDSETYAILLEGLENEGDVGRAKQTFSNVVVDIGWEPRNIAAYDSFLCTLLKMVMREVLKFFDTKKDRACYPGMKFLKLLLMNVCGRVTRKGAKVIWEEMVRKNICRPDTICTKIACSAAVKTYIDGGDPDIGNKMWRYMTDTCSINLDETGNLLVAGLRDMNGVPEAVKCAEDMIERGIKLNSATLRKLKQSPSKVGKTFVYKKLLRKWKHH